MTHEVSSTMPCGVCVVGDPPVKRRAASRSALIIQGKKGDKSLGAASCSAQAWRYSVSQRRGLICQQCTNVIRMENREPAT
jgi:hypothetical protein